MKKIVLKILINFFLVMIKIIHTLIKQIAMIHIITKNILIRQQVLN